MKDDRSERNEVTGDRRLAPTSGRDDHTANSRRTVLEGAVATAVIGSGLLGVVGSAGARAEHDGDEEATASVSMQDQPSDGNIVVDAARLPDGGYVGVHSEHLLGGDDETSMIGVSDYRNAGEHEAVAIDLLELEGIDFEVGQLYEVDRLHSPDGGFLRPTVRKRLSSGPQYLIGERNVTGRRHPYRRTGARRDSDLGRPVT